MSLNLGAATSALNQFFGAFSPQRWKQDLFYRNINDDSYPNADRDIRGDTNGDSSAEALKQANFNNVKEYLSGQYKGFSTNRGVLAIDKDSFDKREALFFQFNPEQITDQKTVEYADRQKPGFDNADYIWSKGGGRTISFELMLDSSLSSYTPDIVTSNGYTHDPKRGTLNQVEFLQSLVRPYQESGRVPKFSRNGITPDTNRFSNPPQVAFAYGPIYLQGVITDLSIEHEAYNRNLAPIRSKASITFRVREDVTIREATGFSSESAIGAEAYEPKTLAG